LLYIQIAASSGSSLRFINEPYRFDLDDGTEANQIVFSNVQIERNNLKGEARFVVTGIVPAPSFFSVNALTGMQSL